VKRALLAVVRFYQRAVSPALPPRCRFYPTCSAYAVEALERHGALRGSWLTLRRLVKCAPWHPGGVDLVPAPARVARGTATGGRSSSMPTLPAPATVPATVPGARIAPADPSHRAMPALHGAPQEEFPVA
jgi:putative membrane protein insertion efficiency factor